MRKLVKVSEKAKYAQKCDFSAFLESFNISLSRLYNPNHDTKDSIYVKRDKSLSKMVAVSLYHEINFNFSSDKYIH